MDDVITLIEETYTKDSIGQEIATETRTDIWARITSVSRAEFYSGGQAGLRPDIVAETARINYSGEKIAEWNSKRYSIYRTYFREDSDSIELYLEPKTGNG